MPMFGCCCFCVSISICQSYSFNCWREPIRAQGKKKSSNSHDCHALNQVRTRVISHFRVNCYSNRAIKTSEGGTQTILHAFKDINLMFGYYEWFPRSFTYTRLIHRLKSTQKYLHDIQNVIASQVFLDLDIKLLGTSMVFARMHLRRYLRSIPTLNINSLASPCSTACQSDLSFGLYS